MPAATYRATLHGEDGPTHFDGFDSAEEAEAWVLEMTELGARATYDGPTPTDEACQSCGRRGGRLTNNRFMRECGSCIDAEIAAIVEDTPVTPIAARYRFPDWPPAPVPVPAGGLWTPPN